MSEITDILQQLLEQLASEVKANIPKASGQTAAGIGVNVSNPGDNIFVRVKGEITAPKYIRALEDGRGPSRKSGGGTKSLRENILQWIKTKGITPAVRTNRQGHQYTPTIESLSWAMAIKIHREGNKLYRDGGKSGVLSVPLSNQRIDNFVDVFNSRATRILLNNVVKTIMA